jgi:hypothetical protein
MREVTRPLNYLVLLLVAAVLLGLGIGPVGAVPNIGVLDLTAPSSPAKSSPSPLAFAGDVGSVTRLEALPGGGLKAVGGRVHAPEEFDVLWCHQAEGFGMPFGPEQNADLLAYLNGGGVMLLSGGASRFLSDLNIDPPRAGAVGPPESSTLTVIEASASQRSHPLFAGLDPGRPIPIGSSVAPNDLMRLGIPGSPLPGVSSPTGDVSPEPVIMEYTIGKGRVILMGWPVPAPDRLRGSYRANLKRLLENALTYLANLNGNRARLVRPPGDGLLYARVAGVPFLMASQPTRLRPDFPGVHVNVTLSMEASAHAIPASGGLWVAEQGAGQTLDTDVLGVTSYLSSRAPRPVSDLEPFPLSQPLFGALVLPPPVMHSILLARVAEASLTQRADAENPVAHTQPSPSAHATLADEIARLGLADPDYLSDRPLWSGHLLMLDEQERRTATENPKTSEAGLSGLAEDGAAFRSVARQEADLRTQSVLTRHGLPERQCALVALFLVLLAVPAVRVGPVVGRAVASWLSARTGGHWALRFVAFCLSRPRNDIPGVKNFAKISGTLYRGAQPTPEGLARLKAMGVKTIINLRETDDDISQMIDLHLKHGRFSLDLFEPDERLLATFLNVVADPQNSPVFVHCLMGADRTGIAVAMYRIREQGWPVGAAIAEMYRFGFNEMWAGLFRYLDRAALDRPRSKRPARGRARRAEVQAVESGVTLIAPMRNTGRHEWTEDIRYDSLLEDADEGRTALNHRGHRERLGNGPPAPR